MHVYSGSPLYNAESYSRWHSYPPPYWYNNSWYYATPWLWYDGNPHGSYTYTQWQSKITARMSQPSPVTMSMWGSYSTDGSGTIYAKFRNDSTATISGNVLFVIVEDSLYYVGSNGDAWHNHVARDYIPNVTGTPVSIPPGDSVTISQAFTTQASWILNRLSIISFLQNPILSPDSIKDVKQGGMIKIENLAIKDNGNKSIVQKVMPVPNPCVDGTKFTFQLNNGTAYDVKIYDECGSLVRELSGIASGQIDNLRWDLKDNNNNRVNAGVYFYRFTSDEIISNGKIVVR